MLADLAIELQVAVIAAGAALGAAIFALIASILNAMVQRANAKLQAQNASKIKLAEFRQRWIDRLREQFVSLQVKIASQPEDIDEALGENIYRIFLMMNKEDTNLELIRNVATRALGKGPEGRAAQLELLELLQDIIKNEWEVVKSDLEG